MLKTVLLLPDGTEISSGAGERNALQSVSLTQSVNDDSELTAGAACASVLEAKLIAPGGELQICAGDEIIVHREDEAGTRHRIGMFTTEKPTRPTANTMKITAYDRVSWLDKDLSQWLASLQAWPYTLLDFAGMVCAQCGVELVNTEIPNGDYEVQAFSASGISGRKLIQWVGQIAGRFCRATPEGKLEFAWYTPSGITIKPTGERFYYQNTLRYEDYETALIEKVQLHLTEDDVGAVWPDGEGEKNTYTVTGNYLLTTQTTEALTPLAQTLFALLEDVTYTPCTVAIPACLDIRAGHTVQITDLNGRTITTYVMTKTTKGQRDTLECTGSHRRDSTTTFNSQSYKALNGKLLEMQQKVEGFSVKASEIQTDLKTVDQGMRDVREAVAALSVAQDGLRTEVSDTQKAVDGLSGEVISTQSRVTSVEQTSRQLQVQVQNISENGANKVVTTTGTFDENGMLVDRSDSSTKTSVTPDGMKVVKKHGEETAVLEATSAGVTATDLHARTYLSVGGRSRFENYKADRTGCYWIGG